MIVDQFNIKCIFNNFFLYILITIIYKTVTKKFIL